MILILSITIPKLNNSGKPALGFGFLKCSMILILAKTIPKLYDSDTRGRLQLEKACQGQTLYSHYKHFYIAYVKSYITMGPGIVISSQYNFQYNTSLGWHKKSNTKNCLDTSDNRFAIFGEKRKKNFKP